jgi:ribosome-dependent ATPase
LIEARGAASLEDAFIAYMEDAIAAPGPGGEKKDKKPDPAPAAAPAAPGAEREDQAPADAPVVKPAVLPSPPPVQRSRWFSPGRMLAYTANETMQIRRDPVRLAFAFVGSLLLMLVFGFGITTDVEHIRYSWLDLDESPESRAYLEQFAGSSRYFTGTAPVISADDALERLQSNDIALVLEVPPNFGRDVRRDSQPEISAQVDGANPYRGETVAQYAQGVHNTMLHDPASQLETGPQRYTANIEERYMYNPTFESIYSIVPSVPALLLILIPAILMAVSVVREKELGSIINFYVTPTGRLEYLMGKQLPYIVIGMINFFILVAVALIVFNVPIKGSFLMLTLVTLLYVITTTGIGLVTSTFTSSQVAAVFVTAILTIMPTTQFSGLLQPVSTLQGQARLIGTIWPTTYYMHSSVGAYTKGLVPALMMQDVLFLACCIPLLLAVAVLGLRKQEK